MRCSLSHSLSHSHTHSLSLCFMFNVQVLKSLKADYDSAVDELEGYKLENSTIVNKVVSCLCVSHIRCCSVREYLYLGFDGIICWLHHAASNVRGDDQEAAQTGHRDHSTTST